MASNPASKHQPAKRGRPKKIAQPKDERRELQKVLELSRPGDYLGALLALYISDSVKLKKVSDQMRRCIETGLKDKVKVHAFGSLVTGLALKESDIDLYVKACDNNPMSEDMLCALIMEFLCATNKSHKFVDIARVRRTRTPIIQCKHRPSQQSIYIHVSHPNGAYNSEFIGDLMRHDKKLRDLNLFLKIWAKDLIENCRMGSYCLICMIIVSLQVHGLMPSIQWLQSSCLPDNVRGVNYSYNLDLAPPIPAHTTTLELIRNFFDLYSTIDFEKKAVCPFLGRIMDKQSILDGDMDEYTSQLVAMEAAGADPPSPFGLITCMYVQDPFDLHSNVAQTVSPPSLLMIKEWLSLANRATQDPELREQPKKLYDYLLFGLAAELAPNEEEEETRSNTPEKPRTTSRKPSPTSKKPSCPKRQKMNPQTEVKRNRNANKLGSLRVNKLCLV